MRVILTTSIIANRVSARRQKNLWKEFSNRAHAHYMSLILPEAIRGSHTSRNGALLMHFLVKMGTGHWAHAEEAWKRIDQRSGLRRESAVGAGGEND